MIDTRNRIWTPSLSAVDIVVLAGLVLWLFLAVVVVDIEYYDGFDTICNTLWFVGKSDHFIPNRTPFIALLLVPAEFIKNAFNLHSLEIRPHHFIMALLHTGYLLGVYYCLINTFGRTWSAFLAFVAAIPTFVFFTYSPFISHDIFPGIIFLVMLILGNAFHHDPQFKTWMVVVVLGAVAALIKHTYAIFWFTILCSHLIITAFRLDKTAQRPIAVLLQLAGGALLSGIITWLALGLVLKNTFPDKQLLMRPYYQILFILGQYNGRSSELFPWWVYIRNLWAYGTVSMALIVPGLLMAIRSSRLQQSMALSWILSVVILHLLPMREVRYMAFVAPLTAFLIVQPLRYLLKKYPLIIALLLSLLLLDYTRIAPEATIIASPFYTDSLTKKLLEPLVADEGIKPVMPNCHMLSFVSPYDSPLIGDRYHRLFHFGAHHLGILYEKEVFESLFSPLNLYRCISQGEKTALILTNSLVINSITWTPRPPVNKEKLVTLTAINKSIRLFRQSDGVFKTKAGQTLVLQAAKNNKQKTIVMEGVLVAKELEGCLYPYLLDPSNDKGFNLKLIDSNRIQLLETTPGLDIKNSWQLIIIAFEIKGMIYNSQFHFL